MTLQAFVDQFIERYSGKQIGFPDNQYMGECLSLVKQFIKEYYLIAPPASGCNGARCYWSMFPSPLNTVLRKVPNTPDLVPKKGWIAVWNEKTGGGSGHIGIVVSATQSTFTSFDQNWGGRHAHLVAHNYDHVDGFLVPIKEDTGGNDMSDEYRKKMDRNWNASRELIEAVLGEVDLTDDNYLNYVKSAKAGIVDVKKRLATEEKLNGDYRDDIIELEKKIEKLEKQGVETGVKPVTEVAGKTGEITGWVTDGKGAVISASYGIIK